ncbi:MAG: polyprenyl synthetase family protein [Frisingicoccus sp.]
MTERNNACAMTEESAMERVNHYIHKIAENSFAGTRTGAVLDDVLGSSGKMIRPRLLLLCSAFGPYAPERSERLCMLAAMVELTHMASLIHDDIIDEAPFRRGKPSIQGKYGKDAAVYAGDFLIERVHYWQVKEQLIDAAMILSQTVEDMCIGEIGQAVCRYDMNVTVDAYLKNIRGKTASLFSTACELGAMEAGCSKKTAEKLKCFGAYLGIMFQFRDDLLDFTSSEMAEGRRHIRISMTAYIHFRSLWHLRRRGREALLPIMRENAERNLSADEIEQMEKNVIHWGGVKRTVEEIHRYAALAGEILDSLEDIPEASKIRRMLDKLETI